MPEQNNFHGHIVWVNRPKRGSRSRNHRWSKSKRTSTDFIAEHSIQLSSDEKTVTCYITAESGRFFAATWWSNDSDPRTAQPYTAEVIRDGESVHLCGFNQRKSAKIQGIAGEWINPDREDDDDSDDDEKNTYYFMFRGLEVSGEDENATAVSDDVGKLQIVIRKMDRSECTEESEDDGDSDSSVVTSESDNSDDDETYDPKRGHYFSTARKGGRRMGLARNSSSREDVNDLFTDWDEKKPRHTHTAAMTRCDGRLWQDQRRMHVPLHAPLNDDSEKDVIVRFIFIYTSTQYIETLEMGAQVGTPRAATSSSSRSSAEGHHDEHEPRSKRRRISPIDYIKTEDEQKMLDEMLAYQKKINNIRITLEARRRARGEAVEGDKGNPIKVED